MFLSDAKGERRRRRKRSCSRSPQPTASPQPTEGVAMTCQPRRAGVRASGEAPGDRSSSIRRWQQYPAAPAAAPPLLLLRPGTSLHLVQVVLFRDPRNSTEGGLIVVPFHPPRSKRHLRNLRSPRRCSCLLRRRRTSSARRTAAAAHRCHPWHHAHCCHPCHHGRENVSSRRLPSRRMFRSWRSASKRLLRTIPGLLRARGHPRGHQIQGGATRSKRGISSAPGAKKAGLMIRGGL